MLAIKMTYIIWLIWLSQRIPNVCLLPSRNCLNISQYSINSIQEPDYPTDDRIGSVLYHPTRSLLDYGL